MRFVLPFLALLFAPLPLQARESLGVFGDWGAFRDPEVPRCYAIAAAEENASAAGSQAFASVGTWPQRQVRGQVHFRLSRRMQGAGAVTLRLGGEEFSLTGDASDAWAASPQMDASILTAMRSAGSMQVSATDTQGRRFTDRYSLEGAATALDAATVGCS